MKKLTINLGDKGEETLRRLAVEQEASQAEIIRRAVGLYALLSSEAKDGNRVVLEDSNGKTRQLVTP